MSFSFALCVSESAYPWECCFHSVKTNLSGAFLSLKQGTELFHLGDFEFCKIKQAFPCQRAGSTRASVTSVSAARAQSNVLTASTGPPSPPPTPELQLQTGPPRGHPRSLTSSDRLPLQMISFPHLTISRFGALDSSVQSFTAALLRGDRLTGRPDGQLPRDAGGRVSSSQPPAAQPMLLPGWGLVLGPPALV